MKFIKHQVQYHVLNMNKVIVSRKIITKHEQNVVKSDLNIIPARGVKMKCFVKVILRNSKYCIMYKMQLKVILPNIKVSMYYPIFRKRPEYYSCKGSEDEVNYKGNLTPIFDIVRSKWKSLVLRRTFTKHIL